MTRRRPYWKEFTLQGRGPQNEVISIPLLYYFDATGTQLAWVQGTRDGSGWVVNIGRPGKFFDVTDTLAEAKKLVQEELGT